MSGRRAFKPPSGSHIFPFLAVLICTMGALVTLLVVIARQAAVHGAHASRATANQKQGRSARDRQRLAAREQELRQAREEAGSALAERRMQLSHVEDHLRRLREQLKTLRASDEDMRQLGASTQNEEREKLKELADVEKMIMGAQEDLVAAQREAAGRPPRYAIIPYEGRNHTRRRPIYIECLADSVILQPEGIMLTDKDFEGPMGPSQPLAAAVRAVQEYTLSKRTGAQEPKDEPYPLLLVRPDGIAAYYAARAALASWGSEFGYELIEQDWDLDFPPPDAQLGRLASEVIAEARIRQQTLIAAAPRQYKRARGSLRASPYRGGFVRDDSAGGGGGGGRWSEASGSPKGGPGGGRWTGRASEDPGGAGGSFRGEHATGGEGGLAWGGRSGEGPGGTGSGLRGQQAGGTAGGGGLGGGTGGFGEGAHDGGGGVRGAAGGSEGAHAQPGSPGSSGGGSQFGSASGGAEGGGGPSSGSETGGAEGGAGATASQSVSAVQPQRRATKQNRVQALSNTRGRDWGIPGASHESFPVTRPIFVRCYPDKLTILADESSSTGKNIALTEQTKDSIDDFVSALWQQMKSWGIAGKGMHWRPALIFTVEPGAVDRYADLKTLLADSGFDVRERNTQPPVAKRPTTNRRR